MNKLIATIAVVAMTLGIMATAASADHKGTDDNAVSCYVTKAGERGTGVEGKVSLKDSISGATRLYFSNGYGEAVGFGEGHYIYNDNNAAVAVEIVSCGANPDSDPAPDSVCVRVASVTYGTKDGLIFVKSVQETTHTYGYVGSTFVPSYISYPDSVDSSRLPLVGYAC